MIQYYKNKTGHRLPPRLLCVGALCSWLYQTNHGVQLYYYNTPSSIAIKSAQLDLPDCSPSSIGLSVAGKNSSSPLAAGVPPNSLTTPFKQCSCCKMPNWLGVLQLEQLAVLVLTTVQSLGQVFVRSE